MGQRKSIGRRTAVRLMGVAGVAGAGAAVFASNSLAEAAGGTPGSEIVGTWMIVSPGPSTRLLQTYGIDGSLLSIHDEHLSRSPQLGSWVRTGDREFLMRNLSFRFDESGQMTGTIDVQGVYTVNPDGDTALGSGVRQEFDLEGNPITPPIQWTSEARRIVPRPLD